MYAHGGGIPLTPDPSRSTGNGVLLAGSSVCLAGSEILCMYVGGTNLPSAAKDFIWPAAAADVTGSLN